MFLKQLPRRTRRFGTDQCVKDNPASFATYERHVREIEASYLIDPWYHFVESVVIVQSRLAQK
jgi:hypothetical protein